MSVIVNILAGAFREAGKQGLKNVLQNLHDKDPQKYKLALLGGRLLPEALAEVVDKTKTKADDAIIDAIAEAVAESAEDNGIDLAVFDAFLADAAEKLA